MRSLISQWQHPFKRTFKNWSKPVLTTNDLVYDRMIQCVQQSCSQDKLKPSEATEAFSSKPESFLFLRSFYNVRVYITLGTSPAIFPIPLSLTLHLSSCTAFVTRNKTQKTLVEIYNIRERIKEKREKNCKKSENK